ncbi:SIMPL domain-containing protein, partial [Patescibacteria group bacterium]|nr:SIMPL domain-containing protein [Patescibacteria group bacterium]
KVRDTAKAGDLLAGVGGKGATEVSGLNFTFDNPDAVQDEARNEAIADAKEKAEVLAKQLGVSLVRVTAFNESGSGYPRPMMYSAMDSYGKAGAVAQVAPEISVGQNQVTNDVSVTYEIR